MINKKPIVMHVFNTSVISGPETLVLPNLAQTDDLLNNHVYMLTESRHPTTRSEVVTYPKKLGLCTTEIEVRSRLDRIAISNFADEILRLKPRIVHAHDIKASTYALQAFHKLKKMNPGIAAPRLVSTHHGVRGRFGIKNKIFEAYYVRGVLPHFDKTLSVCTSDARILKRRGLSSQKVVIHQNGVDRPLVTDDQRRTLASKIRDQWNLPKKWGQDYILVGSVGRFSVEKNPLRALNFFAQLVKLQKQNEGTPVKLIFFGQGPLMKKVIEEIQQLNLQEHVLIYGYRNQVGFELAGLDMLISFSLAEGMPINIIEAGWAGTPVLASAVDGVVDLLDEGRAGLLFDLETSDQEIALRAHEVLNNSALSKDMSHKLQERVTTYFSGRVWNKKLLELYSELL